MKKIDLSKRASDFLLTLPPKQCKQNFTAILSLAKNPILHDARKLQGYTNLYRLDVGEYRIVYSFDDEVISIILIGKRNDDEVYRDLKKIKS
jgi:mRNA interferase RelE/StbE